MTKEQEAILRAAQDSPYFSCEKIKPSKEPDEKTFNELHLVATCTAISGAVAVALAGVMPPLGLVALPAASFLARWLWRKGRDNGTARLLFASVFVLMGGSAFSAEHLYFPYCVNSICKVDDTSPLVRLSPKELAQMRELSDRVYDILVHAWDNTDQTNITTKELK